MSHPVPEDHLKRWGAGDCHVLTIALHRRTGWPIATLLDARICGGGYGEINQYGFLVHSGVITPDGSFMDIYGVHDREGLAAVEDRYLDEYDRPRWLGRDPVVPECDLLEVLTIEGEELEEALKDAEAAIDAYLAPAIAAYDGMMPLRVG